MEGVAYAQWQRNKYVYEFVCKYIKIYIRKSIRIFY